MSTTPVVPEVPTPLQGVRGWLLFFVITLFFNAFLFLTGVIQPGATGITDVVAVGFAGLCIAAAVQLIRRKASGVLLSKVYLYADFGLSVIIVMLSAGDTGGILIVAATIHLIITMVENGIWLAYLSRSKRVVNTYGVQ